MKRYSDIVISCGSGVAGINRFFSVENNAKNAVVMKPSILGLGKFNMVVLPRHDRRRSTPNGSVIVTDIVPNLIDEGYLEDSARRIKEMAGLKDKPTKSLRIGVLLGGDNRDFALTDDITEKLLGNILDASREWDAEILFTTSRRTPKSAENIVKSRLHQNKHCKFLVIANEKNIPHAVGGILGLSDIIVVSGESASMVSEAVSSGKRVIVFNLKRKRKNNSKFESMLCSLKEKGYITVTQVEDIAPLIQRSISTSSWTRPFSEDHYNIYKYMWRLGV